MAGRAFRRLRERVETRALVVRRVPSGDADLLVTLLTPDLGCVTVSARGVRRATATKASKLGAVEPLHTLGVEIDLVPGRDLGVLKEAKILTARMALVALPERFEAAEGLLRWARTHVPHASPERRAFDLVEEALDALTTATAEDAAAIAARAGASLLVVLGYAFELARCVRCGTECPANGAGAFDPAEGGLVCRACGSRGELTVVPSKRRRAWMAWMEGASATLGREDGAALFELVGRTFDAQAAR
ncbi:MAG: DNA repair protein RecO C-terminal domain-containing protein [Polyangiaceae bacterium]